MTPSRRSPIAAVSAGLYALLRVLHPSDWLGRLAEHRSWEEETVAELYALGYLGLLAIGWQLSGTGTDAIDVLVTVIAGWRWTEIFTVGLGIILGREEVAIAKRPPTVALYAMQIALIFSILASQASRHFVTSMGTHPATHLDFLYLAVTNMLTLGNNYAATSGPARAIVLGAGVSGVLLLAVFLSVALDELNRSSQARRRCQ